MRKFISLFLVFTILTLSGSLIAKERRGAELIVQRKDVKQVRGELIAVKESSLLLLDTEGADVSVDIGDVSVIKIKKKSEALKGGVIGFIAGTIIGYYVGYPMGSESGFIFSKVEAGMIGAGIGALFGAGVGLGVGIQIKIYEKVQIERKSPEEIKEALEKLRSEARIPNYQ